MILGIETATEVCSVVFKTEKGEVDEQRTEEYGRHSEKLFRFIESLQAKWGFEISQLNAVVISEGPGSYTGLRIGASGVKGLLYKLEVPLFAVNTLAAIAWSGKTEVAAPNTVHASVNARRSHLYHQTLHFIDGKVKIGHAADLRTLDELNTLINEGDVLVGSGWERLEGKLLKSLFTFGKEKISARNLIAIFEEVYKDKTLELTDSDKEQIIKKVDPAKFDPRYITSKKPGT